MQQRCKLYGDNKNWLAKLKNSYADDDSKTANLYVKVKNFEDFLFIRNKAFLRTNPFKMIGNNWHEPVDDPQIAIYTQRGNNLPQNNTYGLARVRKNPLHAGLDIFSLEGSNVYACLDAEVYEIQKWTRKTGKSGYGQNNFNDALIKFGWTKFLGWTYTIEGKVYKLNHIPKNTKDHHHHLHIEIYNHDFIKLSN